MKKLLLSLFLLIFSYMGGTALATVSNQINVVPYSGDGVSTSFAFNYNIYLNTDLNVYEVTSGVITQLTLNVNYTVALTAVSGTTGAYTGTVNLAGGSLPSGALPVGTTLYLMRNLPYTQLINISDYASTPASTWNQALDRATILALQNYNRSFLQPITATSPMNTPTPIANDVWCWDPTGTFVTNCSGTSGAIAIPITTAGYVNGSALTGSAALTSLTTSGNVGIGTSLPNGSLIVTGGNVGIGSLYPGSTMDVNGSVRFLGSGNTIIKNGNLGVGTLVPGQVLDVVGTVRASLGVMDIGIGTAQTARVCVTSTGLFTAGVC